MKKWLKWFLIIICFLLILYGLYYYILKNKEVNSNEQREYYKESDFVYENFNDINVNSTIYGNNEFILLLNTTKNILSSEIEITFYDINNLEIDKENYNTNFISKDNPYIINGILPKMKNRYAGKINVKITPNYLEKDTKILDKNELIFSLDVNEINNKAEITFNSANPYTQIIHSASCYFLAYKDEQLIEVQSSYFENIPIGGNISMKVDFNNSKDEFDSIKIIIDDLY